MKIAFHEVSDNKHKNKEKHNKFTLRCTLKRRLIAFVKEIILQGIPVSALTTFFLLLL